MFIDTHCHLNMMVKTEFDIPLTQEQIASASTLINEAQQAGVNIIINIGTNLIESINVVQLAYAHQSLFATIGIHPCDLSSTWRQDIKEIKQLLTQDQDRNKIVGIGEIGLDFYHKPFNRKRQEDALKSQIELALLHNLPISFHVRDAIDEFLTLVSSYAKEINRAVIHCFSGEHYFAQQAIDWGFYLGIDAPITYPKNEVFRNNLRNIPLENIVLETDAPFLPPQNYRGKKNHPAYLPITAQALADIKNLSLEQIADLTTKNAKKLFGLS